MGRSDRRTSGSRTDRPDGPAVSARLAQRHRGRSQHSLRIAGFGDRPVVDRQYRQPDDPRRPGPGCRHPGGRGHGRSRKHSHPVRAYSQHRSGGAPGQRANGRAALAGHALYPRRLSAVFLHGRIGPGTFRPLGPGCRFLHGDLLSAVQHVCPGPVRLAAPSCPSRSGSHPGSVLLCPIPERLRIASSRRHAFALAAHRRLRSRRRLAHLAGGRTARTRHLSQCGFRPVSAAIARCRRHSPGDYRRNYPAGPEGHQGRGGSGSGVHLHRLRRPNRFQLSHQHGVPVDARTRRGRPARGLEERQSCPHRGIEAAFA